ncbi:helix-turn-helix transcriptional regulator [Tumebacillus algifaecis]|uniref:helix-turn-helix transcriptional regulator n=1 Tax=Tumebacillus algifaecis TaxID=1214604 RepID=UPI0012FE59FD|nr:helix-turn-helix transcriptional regulator [Tumebacillus algifaecis]
MDSGLIETIGQKVKRLRLEKGMTQSELADGFVTVSMISQIERDRNTASVELLQHLARKLQVALHELVEDEVEQMEKACQQKLIKVYLETKQAAEAEPLLYLLRERTDLSQVESIELTVELGECFYQQGRYDEALEVLLPLAEELEAVNYDDAHVLALIRYTIGNVYYGIQNFTNANYNYRKAYDYTFRFGTVDALAARISYNVGITLQIIGHSNESIYFLDRAYDYFKNHDDIYKVAATIFAQGITYKNMRNYSLAADHLSHAKGLFNALNFRKAAFTVQRTIASTITAKEHPSLALEQLQECISAFEKEKDFQSVVLVHAKIADIHLQTKNFGDAAHVLAVGEELIRMFELGASQEVGFFNQVFARYHLLSNNFEDSIRYALKSASMFDTIGLVAEQVQTLQIACDAYTALDDYKQAFVLERKSNLLLQSISGRRESII